MRSFEPPPDTSTDAQGFTLVEVLIAMAIGLIVSLAAFSVLEFTSNDVTRITERSHADQTGRVALEKIMLQLHSACVAVTINPIKLGSGESTLKFISENSPLNANKEPTSELSTVRLREIIYTAAGGSKEGTLTEKSWPSYGTDPNYLFHETTETPTEKTLLKGVKQTVNETTKKAVPVFQYYRYYQKGDTGAKLGQLNPSPMTLATEEQAEEIAKVSVNFTLAPEGREGSFAKGDRPIVLEDSAIFRLATSSEATGNPNLPCTQTT